MNTNQQINVVIALLSSILIMMIVSMHKCCDDKEDIIPKPNVCSWCGEEIQADESYINTVSESKIKGGGLKSAKFHYQNCSDGK